MYRNNKDKEQDIKSEKAKNTLAEFVVKVNSFQKFNLLALPEIQSLQHSKEQSPAFSGNFGQSQSI